MPLHHREQLRGPLGPGALEPEAVALGHVPLAASTSSEVGWLAWRGVSS